MREIDLPGYLDLIETRDKLRERANALRNAGEVRVTCFFHGVAHGENPSIEFDLDAYMPTQDPFGGPDFAKEIREAAAAVMDKRADTLQRLLDKAGIEPK